MIVQKLTQANLISPPKWLPDRVGYLTIMGSMAYGVNNDDSDLDIYGFAVPPKNIVFPHVDGTIKGFGDQGEIFEQWTQHHIKSEDGKKEYDFAVYNIVKFFQLCMQNNPNMVDCLFTPDNCVIHSDVTGKLVREHRRSFLHKGAWHKFKGYAFAQMSKIKGTANASNPKRQASREEHGYDVKFGYHVVRLMNEVEQIMTEGDLDLLRNREQLKSIRRGEWSLDRLQAYFEEKEVALEQVYLDSKLPYKADEDALKSLLLQCLEEHYGSLGAMIRQDNSAEAVLADLQKIIAKYGK